jgi:hypothetical protein
MEWLQQIVAGGGDEARLAEIGRFGLGAASLQFSGALDHPLFQRLGGLPKLPVALAQCFGGAHPRRHVVAGGDEAAAGQRVESQLDDAAFTRRDLVRLRRLRPAQQVDDFGGGAEPQRRGADRDRIAVERQQCGEAIVEDLEVSVAVEGGDPHADMVERVAQDLVVVADRFRCLVDQGARAAGQQPAAPAEGRHDDAGRGGAQGAGQHALGADERHLDRQAIAGQCAHGAVGTDEARQQLAQFVDARGVGRRLALRLLRPLS